jgi:hypothetical protein
MSACARHAYRRGPVTRPLCRTAAAVKSPYPGCRPLLHRPKCDAPLWLGAAESAEARRSRRSQYGGYLGFAPARWMLGVGSPSRHGTYKFHSEGADGAVANAGAFSASNGHWWLRATNGYTDGGTYIFQPPDLWIATGRLGTGAWRQRSGSTASILWVMGALIVLFVVWKAKSRVSEFVQCRPPDLPLSWLESTLIRFR